MNQDALQLDLTSIHRVVVVSLVITQFVLFFCSIIMLISYQAYHLPFIPYPSMTDTGSTQTHYLQNALLYLIFWGQHIIMATLKYKVAWVSHWKYFPLYDRYIYNIMSGLCLWFMCHNLRPSYHYLFSLSNWICIPVCLVASYALLQSQKMLGKQIMMPFSLRRLLNEKKLTIVPYETKRHTTLITSGVYGTVRHPMQSAVLLLIVFGNGTYTVERLIWTLINFSFVLTGVVMEERRLCVLEKFYREYMNKVKYRFIPYLI